jgi:hypothetical protein
MQPLLRALRVEQAGPHSSRNFTASFLDSLRVPLKTMQERLGHALRASVTLDGYPHAEMPENIQAPKEPMKQSRMRWIPSALL